MQGIDVNTNTNMNRIVDAFETDYKKLFSLAYRMTESVHDAEDVIQNTFVKACKNIDGFRDESKLSTWLYRITINEAYRYLKNWNKLPVVLIAEDFGSSEKEFFESMAYTPDVNDDLMIEEMRERCLRGFLKCVPQQMRVVFLLKNCLELKNKEIAEIMEISEGNAKVLLHRARKRLREMFDYRCNIIDPDKPCKCYLWIKYMNDRGIPLPDEKINYKNEDLKKEHFKNLTRLKQIDYMYHVNHDYTYGEFINNLKIMKEIL